MPAAQDTIVAISTPIGCGGIGVVRVSGPHAREAVTPLLRLRHPLAAGRARFGNIVDVASGDALDEAIITYFAAPNSYTGEDVIEIAAHGSPVLLEYIVRQCCAGGARLAEPGEFTQRAFLAGRIDLTQAEAVDDLIGSSTLEQARVAARQLGGALARTVAPLKASLVGLIAAMEAGIDFAEDDIDVLPAKAIEERIAAVRAPLQGLEQSFAYGRVVRDGFRLAIVGRPNAGKSSLFNRLVERDRAIVTAAPGTTRDLVTERVAIEGIPVDLVDTAGLREGREQIDEAERMGIAKSREAMADADLVLFVIDASAGSKDDGRAVLENAACAGTVLTVWNKCDLAQPSDDAALQAAGNPPSETGRDFSPDTTEKRATEKLASEIGRDFSPDTNGSGLTRALAPGTCFPADHPRYPNFPAAWHNAAIRTSALTGEGIAELRAAIVQAVAGKAGGLRESAMLTNLRQHQAVSSALAALASASSAAAAAIPHEMVMLDLYEALRALDALTGVTTTEDVLRLIFSKFCIGK